MDNKGDFMDKSDGLSLDTFNQNGMQGLNMETSTTPVDGGHGITDQYSRISPPVDHIGNGQNGQNSKLLPFVEKLYSFFSSDKYKRISYDRTKGEICWFVDDLLNLQKALNDAQVIGKPGHTTDFASFTRQLLFYGFKSDRYQRDDHKKCYQNSQFTPQGYSQIKRGYSPSYFKGKRKGKRKAKRDNDDEEIWNAANI